MTTITTSATDIDQAGARRCAPAFGAPSMDNFNHLLFAWLNGPSQPSASALFGAVFLAEWLIWAIPIYLGVGWLVGGRQLRKSVLIAGVAALIGLAIAQAIGSWWPHPRPFMIGLGHQIVAHVPDASFPSDHLTLWWAVAWGSMTQRCTRSTGSVMALTGIAMAWARVYVGVHFPLDMLGALVVAMFSAWLSWRMAPLYMPAAYSLAQRAHQYLFGALIRRGWVRE